LYNGGFSLWENGGNADWWASAYATQFLMECRKAGFEIQEKVLEGGLRYLEQKVKERESSTWFYRENNIQKSRTVPRQEIFYSLYVLALADRASIPSMNYYKSMLTQLTPESKYLLAASYLLAGDRRVTSRYFPGFSAMKRLKLPPEDITDPISAIWHYRRMPSWRLIRIIHRQPN
jgi:uncharacterized protein YfaS (alpha-2-macroglobulin family)